MKCRFSRSQIASILQEHDNGLSASVAALCLKHGISRHTYYNWRAKYGQGERSSNWLIELEGEIGALRQLVHAQIALVEDLQQRLSQTLACVAPPSAHALPPAHYESPQSEHLPQRQATHPRPQAAA